jgi:hypothetical protein
MPATTYVIHATCRYVVQNRETKRTESAQYRPTIAVDAGSRAAAIRKATAQEKKRTGTPHWPVVSFHLSADLVNEIPHATEPQKRVLRRLRDGRDLGCNAAMTRRLVDKGWLEGSGKDGYVLTARGRTEAG